MSFMFKIRRWVSEKLLNSAKGRECALRVADQCASNETVVACHINLNGSGFSTKVSDIFIAYGCERCHAIIDGRINHSFSKYELLHYKARAMQETIQIMLDEEILKLP